MNVRLKMMMQNYSSISKIKNIFHSTFFCVFCCALFSCKPTPKDLTILYGASLEEMQEIAKEEDKKVFCVVLTKPDCPSCAGMVQSLGERYGHLESKVVFNIVDVSSPG